MTEPLNCVFHVKVTKWNHPTTFSCSPQNSMNAMLQMVAVNTVVLTPLGASPAAVTQGTSWMKMDLTAVVRATQNDIICYKF